jgi:hypothetical protein
MRAWSNIASCVLLPLSLLPAGAGCVTGLDAAEGTEEATTAVAQADVLAPPVLLGPGVPPVGPAVPDDLGAVCPSVAPDSPLWPACVSFYCAEGDYGGDPGFCDGDYAGYVGYPGFVVVGGGFGGDHGHWGGSGDRHGDGSNGGHWGGSGGGPGDGHWSGSSGGGSGDGHWGGSSGGGSGDGHWGGSSGGGSGDGHWGGSSGGHGR